MKASELIRKIRALKEAFSEQECEEYTQRLLLGKDIEYENTQELSELYKLTKGKKPVGEDYEAFARLKNKPSGSFTSGQIKDMLNQELQLDPLYRVRKAEEKVAMLEQLVKTLEEKIARLEQQGFSIQEKPQEVLEETKTQEREVSWSNEEEEISAQELLAKTDSYGILEQEEEEEKKIALEPKPEEFENQFEMMNLLTQEEETAINLLRQEEQPEATSLLRQEEQIPEMATSLLRQEEQIPEEVELERIEEPERMDILGQEEPEKSPPEIQTETKEVKNLPETYIHTTEKEKLVPAMTAISILNLIGLLFKKVF